MKKLLFGFFATILLTFTVNAQGTLRANFLKGKTYEEIKTTYIALEKRDKLNLWNEKFVQILSQKIDDNIRINVELLQKEFNNENLDTEIVKKIALNLTEEMSEEQFEDMFMKLDDYTAKIYTQNMVYDGIKAQINEKSMDFNSYVIVIEAGKKIPCNCEWTCSDFCDRPTRNCKMTSSGCGFMWAFECTQAC